MIYDGKSQNSNLKIVDFGTSRVFNLQEMLYSIKGTVLK